jgi:hypothetical protein
MKGERINLGNTNIKLPVRFISEFSSFGVYDPPPPANDNLPCGVR